MEGKRTRIDIIGDMLSSILGKGGEIKPTHLMYKSNMSHTQMRLYLDDLIVKDFVRKIKKGNYDYVIITDKGCDFIGLEFEEAFGL